VVRELLALPAEERAELAWIAELDQRVETIADGSATLVYWEEVRTGIAAALRARRWARAPG
jgi:hypothetical protein